MTSGWTAVASLAEGAFAPDERRDGSGRLGRDATWQTGHRPPGHAHRTHSLPRRQARASARRYMDDQDGMHAIGVAVAALALDPNPQNAFIRGDYRLLRVGPYRVIYVIILAARYHY